MKKDSAKPTNNRIWSSTVSAPIRVS
jgi:hypothetical protein